MTDGGKAKKGNRLREAAVFAVLLLAVGIVGFWEIMANRSRRPFQSFEVTPEDFAGFEPRSPGWRFTPTPVTHSAMEPNILAFRVNRQELVVRGHAPGPASGPALRSHVFVRLVHGYNMPDCMRLKGYTVACVADTHGTTGLTARARELLPGGRDADPASAPRIQFWRLTTSVGDESAWVTSMIRSGAFEGTTIDVCAMPFPRVGTVMDPDWAPEGLTLSSFKHPVRNLRRFLLGKWNNSRCDLLTFLALRPAAYASDEVLTVVSMTEPLQAGGVDLAPYFRHAVGAHRAFEEQLRQWHKSRETGRPGP